MGDSGFLGWVRIKTDNENTSCNSRSVFYCSSVFGVPAYSECKLGQASNDIKWHSTTVTTAATNTTTTGGGVGAGPIQAILGNNSTAAAAAAATHILPITSTMANLSIPLTGSTAMGLYSWNFEG